MASANPFVRFGSEPTYHATDIHGMTFVEPNAGQLRSILQTLEESDDSDFLDVTLVHSTGWSIAIDDRWIATLEHVDADDPMRTLRLSGENEGLAVWLELASGLLEKLMKRNWL